MLFALVLTHRGDAQIYEMRCQFEVVGLNILFIVLPHWDDMLYARMISHPVTIILRQDQPVMLHCLTSY